MIGNFCSAFLALKVAEKYNKALRLQNPNTDKKAHLSKEALTYVL